MVELEKITCLSWRKFIASDAGVKGLLYLRDRTPSIQKGDSHTIIFEAGIAEGWKKGIDAISEILAVSEVKEIRPDND